MVRFTQKNGKSVYVNPKLVSHIIEHKDDKTEIFFTATNTMVNMHVIVIESASQVASKLSQEI